MKKNTKFRNFKGNTKRQNICVISITKKKKKIYKTEKYLVLAGVAQWIECQPANRRAASLTPSQGTCLGCGPGPQ